MDALGLLPTGLVVLSFWLGDRRRSTPSGSPISPHHVAARLSGGEDHRRLAGIGGQLLPLIACAVYSWRKGPRHPALMLTRIWLGFALVAFAMIGRFSIIMPCRWSHRWRSPPPRPLPSPKAVIAVFAIGAGLFVFHSATNDPGEGDGIRRMARVMAAVDGRECPYVFAGDSSLYHLSGGCIPTAYAFPSSLAYEAERGAIGIDESAEVARILARRPPAIVTLDDPFSPWNAATQAQVSGALARDYRLVMAIPREERHELLSSAATCPFRQRNKRHGRGCFRHRPAHLAHRIKLELRAMSDDAYTPPAIWTWDKESGGRFAAINRPSQAPRMTRTCRSGRIRSSFIRWARPTG